MTCLTTSKRSLRIALWVMHLCLLATAVYYSPVNWDEGWTFCTARHLLEDNHYGCRYNGNFTPTRLTTSMSSIFMAYGGFWLFGVSYLSGRLFFAAQVILFTWVYTYLVRKTWGEEVELICLACLLMLSGETDVHLTSLGAHAWGEVPALLMLCLSVVTVQPWFLPGLGAASPIRFLLGLPFLLLSATTKVQFRPFIASAYVAAGIVMALVRRAPAQGILCATLGLATWVLTPLIPSLPMPLHHPLDTTGFMNLGMNLVRTVALVTDPRIRIAVLEWIVTTHGVILTLLALSVLMKRSDGKSPWREEYASFTPLLFLVIGMLLWFVALAIGLPRYAAPALICAAGPIAFVIWVMCGRTLPTSPIGLRSLVAVPRKFRSLFIAALLLMGVFNVIDLTRNHLAFRSYNQDLLRTAAFLNEHVTQGAVVETYDSPLFHLLNVPYIFPADDYHMIFLKSRAEALAKRPEPSARYLALGYSSRWFEIADDQPKGYFEIARFGEFVIYERSQVSKFAG